MGGKKKINRSKKKKLVLLAKKTTLGQTMGGAFCKKKEVSGRKGGASPVEGGEKTNGPLPPVWGKRGPPLSSWRAARQIYRCGKKRERQRTVETLLPTYYWPKTTTAATRGLTAPWAANSSMGKSARTEMGKIVLGCREKKKALLTGGRKGAVAFVGNAALLIGGKGLQPEEG